MIQNETIAAELAAANEDTLTALANKGLYKRALKDTEGISAEYSETDGEVQITVGGEKCVIRSPLEKSSCSCPSRTVCRHILGALLLLKKELPNDLSPAPAKAEVKADQPAEQPQEYVSPRVLSADEAADIRECITHSLSLLGSLLAKGLVRADTSTAEALELAAVRAHAVRMADAERKLRAISGRLSDCIARRASFDARMFTRQLCGCASMLASLDRPEISADELGTFREAYEPYNGRLELLPVGQREVRTGEYRGCVYFFLNMDEKAVPHFLTYSDLRPTFYSTTQRRKAPQTVVWDLGKPLLSLMKLRFTLDKAKLSGEKLSGSSETQVSTKGKADPDCPQFRRLAVTDYRELAYTLEADERRLFVIRIYELESFGFDKYTQVFSMRIKDCAGRSVCAEIKYCAENKDIVETVEKICKQISGTYDLWTMLAEARISDGRVVLEPIEFYDFIDSKDLHTFMPPDSVCEDPYHARTLLRLISETEDALVRIVRSGLASSAEDHRPLTEKIARCGMSGLAELAGEFFGSADAYRHRLASGGEDTLIKAAELMRYIHTARNKLGRISALYDMEKQNNEEEQ